VAAKNESQADSNFAHYFRESLSVVTKEVLIAHRKGAERILLYEPPIKLERKSGKPLRMAVTQTYRIVPVGKEFKAQSTSYTYELLVEDGDNLDTILEFHWHPDTTPDLRWPHLHVNAASADGNLLRAHLPTSRIAIEDFLKVLIRDFGVKSRLPYAQWKEILTRNKKAFSEGASWLYWKPLI
jgi:hypothetical protein